MAGKKKKKSRISGRVKPRKSALGDDPLAWIKEEAITASSTARRAKTPAARPAARAKKKPGKPARISKAVRGNKKVIKSGKPTPADAAAVFRLEKILVISKAAELHQYLKAMAEQHDEITIDASQVESIDTAILQLLTAFSLKLKKQNRRLNWQNPSAALRERCKLMGLEKAMELD